MGILSRKHACVHLQTRIYLIMAHTRQIHACCERKQQQPLALNVNVNKQYIHKTKCYPNTCACSGLF